MPCGRLGKWLAFDDGGYDAAMNDERGDGATCDEAEGDVGEVFHGATFPVGRSRLLYGIPADMRVGREQGFATIRAW